MIETSHQLYVFRQMRCKETGREPPEELAERTCRKIRSAKTLNMCFHHRKMPIGDDEEIWDFIEDTLERHVFALLRPPSACARRRGWLA